MIASAHTPRPFIAGSSGWTASDLEKPRIARLWDAANFELIDGVLVEKAKTTPEYYPMSLNALVNACNQKTNRFPVVNYDEEIVLQAIDRLKEKRMAAVIIGSGRVGDAQLMVSAYTQA